MTFKHIKFEDSAIMRSLEKLAFDKGLVKPETLNKTASVKSQEPTSGSLVEQVIYLCAEMKKSGLEKEARDLEHKLLNYKRANTLYQTSQETGEDLVDQAHPKGSYQLPGLGELGIIETVIDQQLKSLKMVEKKPTGKLANREIIDAVKVILAQESSDETTDGDNLSSLLDQIKGLVANYFDIAMENIPSNSTLTRADILFLKGNINKNLIDPSPADLKDVERDIDSSVSLFKPGTGNPSVYGVISLLLKSGVSEEIWNTLKKYPGQIKSLLQKAKTKLQESYTDTAKKDFSEDTKTDRQGQQKNVSNINSFYKKVSDLNLLLNQCKIKVSALEDDDFKSESLNWIAVAQKNISSIVSRFVNESKGKEEFDSEDHLNNMAPAYLNLLSPIEEKINKFKANLES